MDTQLLLSQNSKRLKSLFKNINPLFGDTLEPDRFLFNVKGFRKSWLPSAMKDLSLINALRKSGSIAKFKRSHFFRNSKLSISQVHISLYKLRLKYDFLFWIHEFYPFRFQLNPLLSLIRFLQKVRWDNRPVRLLIRKYEDLNLNEILSLFILWMKSFSPSNLNLLMVSPNVALIPILKNFFSNWSDYSGKKFRFSKSNQVSSSIFPSLKSKIFFIPSSSPEAARGIDYSFLIFNDMHRWNNAKFAPAKKVIPASFPVIPNSLNSAIILVSGPAKSNSVFSREWKAAQMLNTSFRSFRIPWYDDPRKILKFDSLREKLNLYHLIMNNRRRASFPRYRCISGKYIFELWQQGISLEAINWYLAESTFFRSRSHYANRFPPVLSSTLEGAKNN